MLKLDHLARSLRQVGHVIGSGAGKTHAVATVTAANTPMFAWATLGMNDRVLMVPPSFG